MCMMTETPFDHARMNPMKGDCEKPAYKSKFPTALSPGLEDGDFRLAEGPAIATYLAEAYAMEDWFPSSRNITAIQSRAKIQQYLSNHHSTTRMMTVKVFRPVMLSLMDKKAVLDFPKLESDVHEISDVFASTWLVPEGGIFVGGEDKPSIADIFAYCEIAQAQQLGIVKAMGAEDSAIEKWCAAMAALPHHDECHKSVFKMAKLVNRPDVRSDKSRL